MPDLSSWIAAAREEVAKATPGKWKANLYLGGAYAIDRIAPNGDVLARVAVVDGLLATPANARAIVLAVNSLPSLLDVAEAAMEAERLLRHALDESSGAVDSYEALWIMQSAARGALAAFDAAARLRQEEGQ